MYADGSTILQLVYLMMISLPAQISKVYPTHSFVLSVKHQRVNFHRNNKKLYKNKGSLI